MRRPLSFLFPWLFRGSTQNESERLSYVPIELMSTKRELRPRGSQSQENMLKSSVQGDMASVEEEDKHISVTTEIRQNVVDRGKDT